MTKCIDHGKNKSLKGAGYLRIRYKDKMQYAHRIAYCEAKQIPVEYIADSVIRHTCDNPRCINPQHLLLGTHQDNMDDKVSRHRQIKGQEHGRAKLTLIQVKQIRDTHVKNCRVSGSVALGKRYGVDGSTIRLIIAGTNWKHIVEQLDD